MTGNDFKLTVPVMMIIFNRPDTTKEVFEEIRRGAACQWHAFSADRNGV